MLRRLYQKSRIFIGQEHMFKLDITSSLFFCWDVLVICFMLILKLAITAFTSSYIFGHYDRTDLIFFSFKKSLIYDRKMTETNLASSSSSGTRWAKCSATFGTDLGSFVRSWAAKESKIPKLQILAPMQMFFLICMNRATKEFEHSVVNCFIKFFSWHLG